MDQLETEGKTFKVRYVEELATVYNHVAMVGDGVPDAPDGTRTRGYRNGSCRFGCRH
jgi:hypothetical protein